MLAQVRSPLYHLIHTDIDKKNRLIMYVYIRSQNYSGVNRLNVIYMYVDKK